MKIVEKSNHILIPAQTSSKQNVVNYAILEITDEIIGVLGQSEMINQLITNSQLTFTNSFLNNFESSNWNPEINITFVNLFDEYDIEEEFLYVELEENEIFTLQIPDEELIIPRIVVYKDNSFEINFLGKFSHCEYVTNRIELNKIIE